MRIIEVKNNLVRVNFDANQETLFLSGFLVIKDESQSFIAQTMHLEANSKGNFAILKLLFNFGDDGMVRDYDGSIPSFNSPLQRVSTEELLTLLPIQNPIVMGELAQEKTVLKLDRSIFEEKLLVACEHQEDTQLFTENVNIQLEKSGKKVLIIDLEGDIECSENKLTASDNFKLPLNSDSINFIYEKGLEDANAESKALIQNVFLEVQDYIKTIDDKFLPFDLFKNVVDEQYQELKLVELVLLKNKLLKYQEEGIFAEEKGDFDSLKTSLEKPETTVLDLSKVDEIFQREIIFYAYSVIAQQEKEIYIVVNINSSNSDKKLLKHIFKTEKAHSTIVCPYSYKYLTELKQLAKNLILFAPIQQQNDFASYNTFLGKLNPSEFIVFGNATHHLPLIVKLNEVPKQTFEKSVEEPLIETVATEEISIDEQIKRDVDAIYTAPKTQIAKEETEESQRETVNGEQKISPSQPITESEFVPFERIESEDEYNYLTEDDLDFVEELTNEEETVNGEQETKNRGIEEQMDGGMDFKSQPSVDLLNPSTDNPINSSREEETEEDSVLLEEDEDILPVKESSTPIVPIYSADIEPKNNATDSFEQGDTVIHAKYGRGTVEKLISYGSKTLCSIYFDNVGRRLLDPALSELTKE